MARLVSKEGGRRRSRGDQLEGRCGNSWGGETRESPEYPKRQRVPGKASSGDSLIQEKWDMKEREKLMKPQRFQLKQQVGWSFIIINWTHLWEGPGGKGNWSSV